MREHKVGAEFLSGDQCPATGDYEFRGYADGTYEPVPLDQVITCEWGRPLPHVGRARKAAVWRYVDDGEMREGWRKRPQCQPW